MSTPITAEKTAALTAVGLKLEREVHRRWKVKDSHHSVLEAEVEGKLLSITDMGGHAFRISATQADAIVMVISDWKKYQE